MGDIVIIVAVLTVANVVGWASVQDAGHRPWNWRALLGPWAYYPHLDRKARADLEWAREQESRWRLIALNARRGAPIVCNDADSHEQPCDCGNRIEDFERHRRLHIWNIHTTSSGRFEEARRSGDLFRGVKRDD